MNYAEIVTTLLASVPITGALVIWLGKTTLTEGIKNAIQHEYAANLERLKHEYNEKLERQKSELGALVQRDLEGYRSEVHERDRVALESGT